MTDTEGNQSSKCPDCQVEVGSPHESGCDVARCLATGGQRLSCGGELHEFKGHQYGEHEGECGDDVWTGQWPGVMECKEFGWYAVFSPGKGWVRSEADAPGAIADLNRLVIDTVWDRDLKRFVIPSQV